MCSTRNCRQNQSFLLWSFKQLLAYSFEDILLERNRGHAPVLLPFRLVVPFSCLSHHDVLRDVSRIVPLGSSWRSHFSPWNWGVLPHVPQFVFTTHILQNRQWGFVNLGSLGRNYDSLPLQHLLHPWSKSRSRSVSTFKYQRSGLW